MARLVFNAGDVFTIGGSNTVTEVFGTSGKDTITIAAGAKATLFGFDSADAVSLGGNAGTYTAVRSGSSIVLTDAAGSSVTIPVSTTSQTITFADGARALVYNTASGNVELGSQAVTTTATTVTAGSGGGSSTAGQTFTLTTGVDNVTGTAGDDTINALVTNPTTGADATTIQTLDVINGGAGKDTLNITSTADYNKSLAGLTVSGVEVVNITGANNLAAITTSTAAAVAGTKQVQVLDVANLSLVGEEQTISFVGATASGTSVVVNVLGTSVTTTTVAADTAATVATAVAAKINATDAIKTKVTASATSGVVTLKYAVAEGDVASATYTSGMSSAATIETTKQSSAEVQTLDLDAVSGNVLKNGAGALSLSVLGTTVTTASIADNATETTIATAIASAINTAAATTGGALEGKVKAASNNGVVTLTFAASVGNAAATVLDKTGLDDGTNALSANITAAETRKGGEVDLNVTVNGAQYATKVVLDGSILTATGDALTAAQNANKNAARDAINTLITPIVGDAITVGTSDDAGEIKLTSKVTGAALPTITAAGRDSATNLLSADTADAATVANVVKTNVTAIAQQIQYTVGGTVASGDTFTIYVNGVNYGAVAAGGTSEAGAAANIVTALNTILGAGVATSVGGVVTITAPTAGTALPIISIKATDASGTDLTFVRADVRENATVLGTTTTTGTASVSGSSTFADASEVWLLGASGNASVSAASGQTIGFSGVSSMANTVTFAGTNASIALGATASSGTLTLKGAALTSASLAGTTGGGSTTPLSLADGNTTASIKALNVSTTGSTEINTTGMSALTSITHTGAGALTINRTIASGTNADKLASVTTAGGADQVRIATATAADNPATSIDETVNASVSTGAGNDRVVVATSGSGKTAVDLGDGNDTLILSGIGTGVNSLSGGAGNDVFRAGTVASLSTTSIAGGDGTDTLRTSTGTFALVDYTTLSANVSSVETLQLTSAATLDASKVAMSRIEFLATGTNTVTEVSSSQTLAAVRTPVSDASFGIAAVTSSVAVGNVTAASKGYLVDSDVSLAGQQTVFGDNLNVSMTHVSESATVVAKGNALDLSVTALAATTGATSTTDVTELNSQVTVSGDIRTLNATLTSARGSGTRTDLTATSLGDEAIAKLVVNGIAVDDTSTAQTDEGNLDNLTSIKVSGAGDVTIDAGSLAKEVAKLTSIDLSGMTAFADLNDKGQEISSANPPVVGGYNNLSKSSVTLNNNIAETVILGGGRDTVVTGSKVATYDTVTGFQLTASAANPLLVDTTRSDVLKIGGTSFDSTAALGNAAFAAKMVVTGSTLDAAVLQASTLKGVDASTAVQNVVFHFNGDTFVYADRGTEGLDTDDILVRLSGTLNLDLLIQSGVVIA